MTSKSRKARRKEKRKQQDEMAYAPKEKKKKPSSLMNIYAKDYKKLMLIPVALLVISLIILFSNLALHGEFINKGVSIKGGISLTVQSDSLQAPVVETFLEKTFPDADINARTLSASGDQVGIIVEASGVESEPLQNALTLNFGLTSDRYTLEVTGSTLGSSFYKQMIIAIVFAFALMGIVVYLYFRTLIPSIGIIVAAASNMIITLGFISLVNIRITTAGIAAFLMLIGYSVDTNILLTTRVIKRREGNLDDRIISALKTGLTMTITTIAAITVAYFVSESEVIKQIMIILLVGLIADIFNTWVQNAGILRWHLEKSEEE